MLGGSVIKVMVMLCGGLVGVRVGVVVVIYFEFLWFNVVGLKERVDVGCWLGVWSVWVVCFK